MSERSHNEQEHDKGWKNSSDAPLEKAYKRKTFLLNVMKDQRRDQEARDDEEDVNPNKAARKAWNSEMVENHGSNGNRPKPVNVRTIETCHSCTHGPNA